MRACVAAEEHKATMSYCWSAALTLVDITLGWHVSASMEAFDWVEIHHIIWFVTGCRCGASYHWKWQQQCCLTAAMSWGQTQALARIYKQFSWQHFHFLHFLNVLPFLLKQKEFNFTILTGIFHNINLCKIRRVAGLSGSYRSLDKCWSVKG